MIKINTARPGKPINNWGIFTVMNLVLDGVQVTIPPLKYK
jgi:hypothetical protein